jgi:CRP-like cAMP-binding protein
LHHQTYSPMSGWKAIVARPLGSEHKAETGEDETMQREDISKRMEAVRAYPLAELLECPLAIKRLLSDSVQSINFVGGEIVFRQSEVCRGLYLVVSGLFPRRTERRETRLMLSPARVGELVELAAVLGDGHHTYTLTAQGTSSVLMLPIEALESAFQNYPPLRMQLLEELAREVSRAYNIYRFSHIASSRRRNSAA